MTGLSSGVVAITSGYDHTCALMATGDMQCWGRNTDGQLGNNSTTDSPVPVGVTGLSPGVSAMTAGESDTCALTTAGTAQCWGSNMSAVLGNNSTTGSLVPTDVTVVPSGILAIATSGNHTCVLTAAAGMQCWGYNGSGELGNGTTTDSPVPVTVIEP